MPKFPAPDYTPMPNRFLAQASYWLDLLPAKGRGQVLDDGQRGATAPETEIPPQYT